MENIYLVVLLFISTLAAITLWVAFTKEKKKNTILNRQIHAFNEQTDKKLYARGKFSELGLMTAGITHEISNPLSIILGRLTQMLKRDPGTIKSEDLKRGLEQIMTNAERITKIITTVRHYIYRKDEQEEDFIPLKEIIVDVLMFYDQRLKNHGIELRLKNIDKVYISGHKGQLEQVFLNLISNSFDAVDDLPVKWIEISAVCANDKVQIYFKDSGHGIPKEVSSKMLDPFYTTKIEKGSGLGLSLVDGIVKNHGGTFKYIESPHTTFLLELPQASAALYHH